MRDFWIVMRMVVNCVYPLALIFSMTNFKCRRETARIAYAALSVVSIVINVALFYLFGREIMMRFFAVTISVPCIVLLLLLTSDRFSLLFFSFFTAINALYLVSIIGRLIAGMDEIIWLDTLIKASLYSVILFLFKRYFSTPFHFLAAHMRRGWGVISALPFLFFFIVMFLGLYPSIRTDNFPAVLIIYCILCLVYLVIYQVFRNTYDRIVREQEGQLLSMQLTAQKQYYETLLGNEQELRRVRHDIQGHLNTLSALLGGGKYQEASDYLAGVAEYNDGTQKKLYCKDPYLNAALGVFSARFDEAGIPFSCNLALGDEVFPHVELCLILNNALENALEASLKLPAGERRVQLQMRVRQGQFLLRIRNRFDGALQPGVRWPLSTKGSPDHGYGLSTIEAAVRKMNGDASYHVEDGYFVLDIMIKIE